jgi:hypothetical protein
LALRQFTLPESGEDFEILEVSMPTLTARLIAVGANIRVAKTTF